MIDIHCHILPNVDDGASSLDEALDMARMALQSGVSAIVATPHFRGDPEAMDQLQLIHQRYKELKQALDIWNIPLRLHKGAEILCTDKTPDLASEGKLPTISSTRYVLTEFYFDESFDFMDECLSEISSCGYRPIIAHPERYNEIQQDPLRARRWANYDYVLQLNKGSVLSSFGPQAESTANALLELGLAHLFASDAHSCHNRTPHIGKLKQWAEEFCDPTYASLLLEENPQRVLRDIRMASGR